ncbi:MAG: hypothetical protein ACPG21_04425 [Crocinitomicaceae bacterium]
MSGTEIVRYYLTEEKLDLDSAQYWLNYNRITSSKTNSPTLNLGVYETFSKYYLLKEQYDSSLYYIDLGLQLFPFVQEKQDKIVFLYQAASSFEKMGDYKRAYLYYRDATRLRKETYNERNSQIFANIKNNHEIEKRDQAIALSQKENTVKDAQIESDQN